MRKDNSNIINKGRVLFRKRELNNYNKNYDESIKGNLDDDTILLPELHRIIRGVLNKFSLYRSNNNENHRLSILNDFFINVEFGYRNLILSKITESKYDNTNREQFELNVKETIRINSIDILNKLNKQRGESPAAILDYEKEIKMILDNTSFIQQKPVLPSRKIKEYAIKELKDLLEKRQDIDRSRICNDEKTYVAELVYNSLKEKYSGITKKNLETIKKNIERKEILITNTGKKISIEANKRI